MTSVVAAEKEILRIKNQQATIQARITEEVTKARVSGLQGQIQLKQQLALEQARAKVAETVVGSEDRRIARLGVITRLLRQEVEGSERYNHLQAVALKLQEQQATAEWLFSNSSRK